MNEINAFIKKAEDSIYAAEILLEKKLYGFSVSRIYYAMFYISEALLLTKGISFSTHHGVISGFGKEFIQKGIFDKKFGRALNKAYELRENGDYEPQDMVSEEEVKTYLELAKEFLEAAKKYLEKKQ